MHLFRFMVFVNSPRFDNNVFNDPISNYVDSQKYSCSDQAVSLWGFIGPNSGARNGTTNDG